MGIPGTPDRGRTRRTEERAAQECVGVRSVRLVELKESRRHQTEWWTGSASAQRYGFTTEKSDRRGKTKSGSVQG